MLCLATDPGGALLASGGADGRVCLWQWGADQFLHQGDVPLTAFLRILDLICAIVINFRTEKATAAGMQSWNIFYHEQGHPCRNQDLSGLQVSATYLTNVPVAAMSFLGASEIAVALESPHILGVRLARKTSQSYATTQDPRHHIRSGQRSRVHCYLR